MLNRNSISNFGIFLIFLLFTLNSKGQTIKVNGIIHDYKWAHHSNHLVVLYEDKLAIFEAGKAGAIKEIKLSTYFSSVEWTKDDTDFLLGENNTVYQYNTRKNSISKYIEIEGCGSTWNVSKISLCANSNYWAIISNCEAFPTLHIFFGKKRINELDFGLAATAEIIMSDDILNIIVTPMFEGEGEKMVYTFNSLSSNAYTIRHHNFPKVKSFDGQFSASFQHNEDETSTITILKIKN